MGTPAPPHVPHAHHAHRAAAGKLREVFFGTKTVYLVMECCRGGELFEQFTKHAPSGCSERLTAALMKDMFSAVRYLHTHGVAHRDLKLENFLFEGDNGMYSALKLIDFGLSKTFTPGEVLRQVVGSAYYTAPEVRMGSQSEG